MKRFASRLCLKRRDSEYPKCWTFEIVNNLAVFQEASLESSMVSYPYSTQHVHELSFCNLACIYLCTRVLAIGQCSIPLSFLHPTGVVLNSIYVQSQGRIIVDGVLVLILTCTPQFYDNTFGLILLLMWTLLSKKLQNFNIIVMIIHCAGLCFKCKVSMHGLVPLCWKLCGRATQPGNEANGHTCSVHCMDQSGTINLRFVCSTYMYTLRAIFTLQGCMHLSVVSC